MIHVASIDARRIYSTAPRNMSEVLGEMSEQLHVPFREIQQKKRELQSLIRDIVTRVSLDTHRIHNIIYKFFDN